jgi:hypothetical protein
MYQIDPKPKLMHKLGMYHLLMELLELSNVFLGGYNNMDLRYQHKRFQQ